AAAGAIVGAAFGGHLGVTTTSGPGVDLKSETMGLAISLELPLLVIDIQRGGPSTGLPTKTEQSDLLLALFGRHGAAPLPVLAPRASSTESAGSRRRTAPATSPTTPPTTRRWSGCGPPRWRASPRTSRPSRSTTRTAPSCWYSVGARPTAPSPPACSARGLGA